jgi:hypothetical protein
MAWHEYINGNYVLCFRVGEKTFRRSLNSTCKEDADDDVNQIEINLRKLEREYLKIPKGADVVSLFSNGHVTESLTVPNQTTLKILFDRYFAALPKGSLEETAIVTMKVHRKSLEGYFGKSKLIESIDLVACRGTSRSGRGISFQDFCKMKFFAVNLVPFAVCTSCGNTDTEILPSCVLALRV